MKKNSYLLSCLAIAISSACHAEVLTYPDPLGSSQSDFGSTGLLQMPNARITPEGEFSINYQDNNQYQFYSTSMALFPWLEGTIHYTDVHTHKYSQWEDFSSNQSYKDKSFNFKLHLWEEGYWLPQVAFGKHDIAGTGLFNSEYLVASKQAGPFDFTLRMAWGYTSNAGNITNPFCQVSNKYCHHAESHNTGNISFSNIFHGPASIFGSIEYQTPWNPLHLKLKYNGNNYQNDFTGKLPQASHFNISAVYHAASWADLNLSYEHSNTLMFGFTLQTNFNNLHPALHNTPKPAYQPAPESEGLQYTTVANQLTTLKYNTGFDTPEIQLHNKTLYMSGQQYKYHDSHEAVNHANQILVNNLPQGIEKISMTQKHKHMAMVTTKTNIASLHKQLAGTAPGQSEPLQQQHVEAEDLSAFGQGYHIHEDHFSYSFNPTLSQSLGSPEDFYMFQLGLMSSAHYWFTNHLLLDGSIFTNIYNNYNKFKSSLLPTDSTLPHVHTHIHDYIHNDIYLNNLQANYFADLGNGFYGQVYGSYLETMYTSVSSKLLYHPLDACWALGVDINYMKQHDWDNMMHFTNYSTPTGFMTAYWNPPTLNGILMKLSIGQYLAKDKGTTINITKHFDSSVAVGVWAAISNISKDDYSKGSFSKGFYISIPFNLMTIGPNHNHTVVSWTPLTRDGGQMLSHKYQLYPMTAEQEVPVGQ